MNTVSSRYNVASCRIDGQWSNVEFSTLAKAVEFYNYAIRNVNMEFVEISMISSEEEGIVIEDFYAPLVEFNEQFLGGN